MSNQYAEAYASERLRAPVDLTIVIPAFNEAVSVARVIENVTAALHGISFDLVVVDDGSSDDTAEVARRAGANVVQHARNLGYGAALKTGFKFAQSEYVVTFDADGQHRASDILRLWEIRDRVDMAVGARTQLLHSPFWRMPGKWLLGWMAQYLTRQQIPDLNSGLRVFRRPVSLKYLHLCPPGFSLSTTMTLAMLCRGWRVEYVPIEVVRREGKSTVSVTTGLETIVLILRLVSLFDPLRVFVPASMIIAGIGIVWEIPIALAGRGISVGSMLAIVTGVLLFGLGLLCDQISQLRLERFE
jgi:glycosyltransferase involved in cell wall biosynthesis